MLRLSMVLVAACWMPHHLSAVALASISSDDLEPPHLKAGAEQVHVQLTGTPGETVVYWISPMNVSQVRFGKNEGSLKWKITSDSPQQYRYTGWAATQGSKTNYISNFMHEVTLKGLDPETEYFYKCGEWVNGFSDTFSFRTQSDNANAPVYFSAIGDQGPDFGDAESASNSVLQRLIGDRLQDSFALHAGDATYAMGDQVLKCLD